jgi:uncharacterized protein YacL
MSRKAIIVFLLVYLFIAFAGSILWELATPELADVQSEAVIGQTIGLIVGLFVLPGVLPLTIGQSAASVPKVPMKRSAHGPAWE